MAKWVFDIPDEVVDVVVPQLKEVIEYEVSGYEFRKSHPVPDIQTRTLRGIVTGVSTRPPLVLAEE